MPNDIDLTGGSWRTQSRGTMDPSMRRLGLIAGGIAVVALGVGGWSVMSHRTHAVPVIEADSRPIRMKPENPGGMQIAGAEEQIMGGTGNGQADAMAPLAEAPAPQALRAQVKASQPSLPAAVAAPVPEPVVAAPVVSAPVVPAPVAPAPVAAAVPAHPVAAPHPVSSGLQVQLAALESEQAAMAEWQRLAKRMPDLLGGRQPAVQKTERDGRTLYRLRTSGFADVAAATVFCNQLRTKGAGCAIATF